jgi:sorbitol-specific phosphotransferase system component IIBC
MEIAHEITLLAKCSGRRQSCSACRPLPNASACASPASSPASSLASSLEHRGNVVLVYFFVGRDMGIDYIMQSAPHGIASFSATMVFVLAYCAGSSWFARYSPLAGSLLGIAAFTAVAGMLSVIAFTLATATTLTPSELQSGWVKASR